MMKKEYIKPQAEAFQLYVEVSFALSGGPYSAPTIAEDDDTDFASF